MIAIRVRYFAIVLALLVSLIFIYFLRYYQYLGKSVDIYLSKDGMVMLPVQLQLNKVLVYRAGLNYLCVSKDGLVPKLVEPLHRDAPGWFESEGLCLKGGSIYSIAVG